MYFDAKYLEMRDVLADAMYRIPKRRKQIHGPQGYTESYRASASTWKRRPMFRIDNGSEKGAHVRFLGNGVGSEASQYLSKIAAGSNLFEPSSTAGRSERETHF